VRRDAIRGRGRQQATTEPSTRSGRGSAPSRALASVTSPKSNASSGNGRGGLRSRGIAAANPARPCDRASAVAWAIAASSTSAAVRRQPACLTRSGDGPADPQAMSRGWGVSTASGADLRGQTGFFAMTT
jgi:hypothetical protein